MLGIKRKDKILLKIIERLINCRDAIKFIRRQKWGWVGHMIRLKDNRWT